LKIKLLAGLLLVGVSISTLIACDMGTSISDTSLPTSSSETPIRALWLWSPGGSLASKDEQDNFFRVLTEGDFNTAYVQVAVDILQKQGDIVATFIDRAHSLGINIYGIVARRLPRTSGDNGISIVPDPDPSLDRSLIEAYLQYNFSYPNTKIDGIIWDIEPIENNMLGMVDYMHAVKNYSYQGQTLLDQGMKLAIFCAAPRFLTSPRGDYKRMPEVAKMYQEFDLIAFSTYWDDFNWVKWAAGDGPQMCETLGIDFVVGFESDESTENSILWVNSSLFKSGKQRYFELVTQSDDFFRQWIHYKGSYLHHWGSAISWWWEIAETEILPGNYHPGDTIPVMVKLFRGRQYSTSVVGIKVSIRYQDLNWMFSKVVALYKEVTVIIDCSIPGKAPPAMYDVQVSTWDLDLNMDNGPRTSFLLNNSSVAQLESLTMEELEAASLSGTRLPFVKLDSEQLTLNVLPTN
jgi:hypothetical protein